MCLQFWTKITTCTSLRETITLALYHYETCGLYVYASTEAILDRALARLGIISIEHQKIDTTCGDILKIDSSGAMEHGIFDTTNLMVYDYRYFHRDWWNVPETMHVMNRRT